MLADIDAMAWPASDIAGAVPPWGVWKVGAINVSSEKASARCCVTSAQWAGHRWRTVGRDAVLINLRYRETAVKSPRAAPVAS